jgi:predicted DNA-binding protein with PD1-like motif
MLSCRRDQFELMNLVNPVKLFAARTSAGMKITQDVREYAAQKQIDEQAALGVGMKEKAEFVAAGGEIYR